MKRVLIGMVRLYKTYVSPFLPSACRFQPTCSEYAVQALEKHGSLRGMGLAIYRLLRCQPFSKGGYDPVP
jgi:putative membrane protein insertion efficiency factor